MNNPNFSSLVLSANAGEIASIVMTVITILLGICLVVLIWWVDIKKQPIRKIGGAIGHWVYEFFDKFNDLVTNNLPVQTVYSDKTKNYSGTEFLPVPSKAPTKQYTYTFLGWNKNGVDKNGNMVVKAIYLQKVRKVAVNFYDYDRNTILKSYDVDYGAGVDVSKLAMKRPETNEFSYEFVGWDKDTLSFYENTNVYPIFKALPKKYNYTFYGADGKSILSQGSAIYGTPIIAPKAPSKLSEDQKFYEFVGWKNYTEGMLLTKDVEFFAEFSTKLLDNNNDEQTQKIVPEIISKPSVIPSQPAGAKPISNRPARERKRKNVTVIVPKETQENLSGITVIAPNSKIVKKENNEKVKKLKPKS